MRRLPFVFIQHRGNLGIGLIVQGVFHRGIIHSSGIQSWCVVVARRVWWRFVFQLRRWGVPCGWSGVPIRRTVLRGAVQCHHRDLRRVFWAHGAVWQRV